MIGIKIQNREIHKLYLKYKETDPNLAEIMLIFTCLSFTQVLLKCLSEQRKKEKNNNLQ